MAEELKYKPLIEAILEVKWRLQGQPPVPQTDPHYKILLGRLFDRFLKEYPAHEQLAAANIPDEIAGYVIQHRFRVADKSWPLVQIGPGIFTVNSAADYKWPDFLPRVLSALTKLYDAYPKVGDLKITNLILRYVDAVDFDYKTENIFDFLRDKLKLGIVVPSNLFEGTGVTSKPEGFTWQCTYKSENPKGNIIVRFSTGQVNGKPALVWETMVEASGENLPDMPNDFEKWIVASHEITDNWFFKMIEGDLKRRFSGE